MATALQIAIIYVGILAVIILGLRNLPRRTPEEQRKEDEAQMKYLADYERRRRRKRRCG